jgi:hypothetical protein
MMLASTDKATAMSQPKPLYHHDCDQCRFLGSVRDADLGDGWVDLYAHAHKHPADIEDHGRTTLLARYGNAGPDYTSIPAAMLDLTQRTSLKAAGALVTP